MATTAEPVFRELSRQEAEGLLSRNSIGRLAFTLHDEVYIEPIHYVFDAPWVFGRTSPGTKLLALAQDSWCAFEVDAARGLFDWESVVIKGPVEAMNSALGTSENYERALAAVRKLIPETMTEHDPAPERSVIFGIRVERIEGRAARSGS